MSGFLGSALLANVVGATVLAGVAALCSRRLRPELAHALWLLVLLELVSLPLVRPLLPAWEPTTPAVTMATPAPATGGQAAIRIAPARMDAAPTAATSRWRHAPLIVWAAGAALLAAWTFDRTRRLGRLVRAAPLAGAALRQRADRLAAALALQRAPPIRLVRAPLSPATWMGSGQTEILLPAALLEHLAPAELDVILTHELAHVRRRDQWVRLLEAVVTIVYWWHPVVWWTRRNVHRLEEACCDRVVTSLLPTGRRSCVEGLLKTVEFLGQRRTLPVLATGAATHDLKERIAMILQGTTMQRTSPRQRLLIAAVALVLSVTPDWMHSAPAEPHAAELDEAELDAGAITAMVDMERAVLQIERQLRELELERVALHAEAEQLRFDLDTKRLQMRLEQAVAAGDVQLQSEIEMELAERQLQLELERTHLELERRHHARWTDLEFQLRDAHLALQLADASADTAPAQSAMDAARALEHQLRELQLQELEHQLALQRELLEAEEREVREDE